MKRPSYKTLLSGPPDEQDLYNTTRLRFYQRVLTDLIPAGLTDPKISAQPVCILSREISTDPSGVSWANPDQVLADPVGGFPTVPFAFRFLVKTAAPYMEIKWSRDVTKQSSAKGSVKLRALIDAGIVRDGGNAKIFTGGQLHAGGGRRTQRIRYSKLRGNVREFWGADGYNGPE